MNAIATRRTITTGRRIRGTACVLALGTATIATTALTIAVADGASAIPDPITPGDPVVVTGYGLSAPDVQADIDTTGRPCFLVRAHWNDALDGHQPLC